jgi:hypothetical protein
LRETPEALDSANCHREPASVFPASTIRRARGLSFSFMMSLAPKLAAQ